MALVKPKTSPPASQPSRRRGAERHRERKFRDETVFDNRGKDREARASWVQTSKGESDNRCVEPWQRTWGEEAQRGAYPRGRRGEVDHLSHPTSSTVLFLPSSREKGNARYGEPDDLSGGYPASFGEAEARV